MSAVDIEAAVRLAGHVVAVETDPFLNTDCAVCGEPLRTGYAACVECDQILTDNLARAVLQLHEENERLRAVADSFVRGALHEGHAERRAAEGDNAWTTLQRRLAEARADLERLTSAQNIERSTAERIAAWLDEQREIVNETARNPAISNESREYLESRADAFIDAAKSIRSGAWKEPSR